MACLLTAGLAGMAGTAPQERRPVAPPTPGPMLERCTMTIDTPELTLMLVRSSQTSAGLKTRGADAFDVTPGARLVERSQNGFCHLGDLDLRLRASSSGEWRSHSTAAARAPVAALPAATPFTPAARLRVEQPAKIAGVGTCAPAAALASEREAFVIPLTEAMSCVELRAK